MKLPIAVHPANHLHVQSLLLHGGLCADDAATAVSGRRGRRELLSMARTLALSRVALEDALALPAPSSACCGPKRESLRKEGEPAADAQTNGAAAKRAKQKPAWSAIAAALRGLSGCYPPTISQPAFSLLDEASGLQPEGRVAAVGISPALAFMAPARLVALHAPRTLLPPLHRTCHHDAVTYDAALHHTALLTQLLAPYGLQVSLTGCLRRGCPAATHAEFLVSLTEAATEEVEAVPALTSDDPSSVLESEEHLLTEQRLRRGTNVLHRDALTLPFIDTAAATAVDEDGGNAVDGTAAPLPPLELAVRAHEQQEHSHGSRRRQRCSWTHAFAAADPVSPQVAYRTQRAIQRLIQRGYAVAGRLPLFSCAALSRREPLQLSVRYDTHCPSQVPPVACTDAAVLSRLRLHRLRLHFCPWQSHPSRLLLLTGPPAFTAHVCLRALEHGVDVNLNGVFEAVRQPQQNTTTGEDEARGGAVLADVPLLEREDVVRVVVAAEADIFEMARLPVVDPLLRKVYCQMHHLE